jgi:hypothetical protein
MREATRFTYDSNGILLSITDARNNPTYDPIDRLPSWNDPLGRSRKLRLRADVPAIGPNVGLSRIFTLHPFRIPIPYANPLETPTSLPWQ